MLAREELSAWLWLAHVAGVGPDSARRLLATFGSPEAVLQASEAALRCVVSAERARSVHREPDGHAARLAATCAWLEAGADEGQRHLLTLGDPCYPAALLQVTDPPLLLYACGDIARLALPSIAVVGSRRATPQGLDNAQDFAQGLSMHGLAVVSGLALGIDAAAHQGGLEGPGRSIAFVGTGLDQDYPTRNRPLAARLRQEGLIVSEYALGTPPLPINFPRRNRLIAGVSRGTLVVEAALKSGSLITARLAAEAGREVFAIPGSIHAPQARGCHRLIQQGAKLVESVADVLDELGPEASPAARAAVRSSNSAGVATTGAEEAGLVSALGHDPVTLDALAARTGWLADRLSARLLDLELSGRIQRLPGGLYQRRDRA